MCVIFLKIRHDDKMIRMCFLVKLTPPILPLKLVSGMRNMFRFRSLFFFNVFGICFRKLCFLRYLVLLVSVINLLDKIQSMIKFFISKPDQLPLIFLKKKKKKKLPLMSCLLVSLLVSTILSHGSASKPYI